MQQIRDDKMKSVLDKNSDKVRSDIKDLIKRQLQNLYFEHHDDLWTRRLKANKLKEIDELMRIGLQEEAEEFGEFIANQGAEQCGFCNPGFVMNTIALLRENPDPTDDEIRAYLAGNLCRCSGYEGQTRGIRAYLNAKKEGRL